MGSCCDDDGHHTELAGLAQELDIPFRVASALGQWNDRRGQIQVFLSLRTSHTSPGLSAKQKFERRLEFALPEI